MAAEDGKSCGIQWVLWYGYEDTSVLVFDYDVEEGVDRARCAVGEVDVACFCWVAVAI